MKKYTESEKARILQLINSIHKQARAGYLCFVPSDAAAMAIGAMAGLLFNLAKDHRHDRLLKLCWSIMTLTLLVINNQQVLHARIFLSLSNLTERMISIEL